jgi:hypothetical protein
LGCGGDCLHRFCRYELDAMTPYEEGQQAAKEGKPSSSCPYTYSNVAPPGEMDEYLKAGWQQMRNEWADGWHSVTAAP